MPIREMPTFGEIKSKTLSVPNPGIGGLNLYDLEYEQEVNQSPRMLNMMYRNGTFSKRYGQTVNSTYDNEVFAIEDFNGKLIVHTGTNLLVDGETVTAVHPPAVKGLFIKFYQTLLYYCNGTIYEYTYDRSVTPYAWVWRVMDAYIPDCFTECQPASGGTYNKGEDINLLTLQYKCVYSADGTADYYPYGNNNDIIDFSIDPIVVVDEVAKTKGTDYTVDTTNKKISFITGHYPSTGTDNVEITYTCKSTVLSGDRTRLMACKYYANYGANGSSHLFLGGGGDGKVFYSDSYDHTYFPENNWIVLGSTEKDITGFGLQYNVLIAFKPKEIFSLYSYNVTASMVTSDEEDEIGSEAFGAQIVNSQVGCDAPYTIQLINNQLTWFNSNEGVCTLVSTNIADERNVRIISRNINHTNNLNVTGILDIDLSENNSSILDSVLSIDYDYKYFLCFPKHYTFDETTSSYVVEDYGMCYAWDYAIAPFTYTSSKVTDPKTLDWLLFDNFYVKQFLLLKQDLIYLSNKKGKKINAQETYDDKYLVIKLGEGYSDIDLTDIDKVIGINAIYRTPLLQFEAVEYLKTVKNIYIQCRADTATIIQLKAITEENPDGESLDPIIIGKRLWKGFEWSTFTWSVVNFANVFRRKVSLKKIKMVALELTNNEANRDMSVSHMAFQYFVVKEVK